MLDSLCYLVLTSAIATHDGVVEEEEAEKDLGLVSEVVFLRVT